eukprot:scaffold28315_cov48-Phaeocystis_antarctica.AAC.2
MEASTATRGSVCRRCLTRLRGVPARGVPARGVSGRGEAMTPSIRALVFCSEWSCCSHGPSSPPPAEPPPPQPMSGNAVEAAQLRRQPSTVAE